MIIRAIAICTGLIAVVPAAAQTDTSAPESTTSPSAVAPTVPPAAAPMPSPTEREDPRYSFNRVEDGYLRLDTRTGQVALCSRRQVGWACRVLPDDRTVLEAEIARLQQENGALKKELLSRGIALPKGVRSPPAGQANADAPDQPKQPDSDFNRVMRVMTMVEAMWRRLVDMIGNLQRDKKT